MNKLIYDEYNHSPRYFEGSYVTAIVKNDNQIKDYSPFKIKDGTSVLKCCDPVKGTDKNWFYVYLDLYDESTISLVHKWLEEVSSVFPEFKIEMYKEDKISRKEIIQYKYGTSYYFISKTLKYCNEQGNFITLYTDVNPISDKTYGFTNSITSKKAYFDSITSLMDWYLLQLETYDIKTIDISDKDFIKSIIKKNITDIYKNINHDIGIVMDLPDKNNRYTVCSSIVLDIPKVPIDDLVCYIYNVIENKNNKDIIKKYLSQEDENYIYIIQALYSNSTNVINSYLAHILIRAAFTEECRVFIEQYFKIKEQTKDMYFWNRIFLTQFGFRFHYYYWLTSDRVFRFVEKEEFEKSLNNCKGFSVQELLHNFTNRSLSLEYIDKLKEHYIQGNLEPIIDAMKKSVKVKVKVKNSIYNLRLSSIYTAVLEECSDSFSIQGDDFTINKYNKELFEYVV